LKGGERRNQRGKEETLHLDLDFWHLEMRRAGGSGKKRGEINFSAKTKRRKKKKAKGKRIPANPFIPVCLPSRRKKEGIKG